MPVVFYWEMLYPFASDMSVWSIGVKRLVLCFLYWRRNNSLERSSSQITCNLQEADAIRVILIHFNTFAGFVLLNLVPTF
jgi:hypothetical protein